MVVLLLAGCETSDGRLRAEVVGGAEVQIELLLYIADGHGAHGLIVLSYVRLAAAMMQVWRVLRPQPLMIQEILRVGMGTVIFGTFLRQLPLLDNFHLVSVTANGGGARCFVGVHGRLLLPATRS